MSVEPLVWKSINAKGDSPIEIRRALQRLDRFQGDLTGTINNNITQLETNITNIINGSTPAQFRWKQYTGS